MSGRLPKPIEFWRYNFASRAETHAYFAWAILFLDETGCFSVLSDYGNFGFRWTAGGWGKNDFRDFIAKVGDDYLLSKLTQGVPPEYDSESTIEGIKEFIVSQRRQACIEKEKARNEWDLLEKCDDLRTERDFESWAKQTTFSDEWEFMITQRPQQARAFMKFCWPGLKALIDADLCRTQGLSVELQLHAAQEENLRLEQALHDKNEARATKFVALKVNQQYQNRRIKP